MARGCATSPGGVCSATTVPTDFAGAQTEFGNGPGVSTNGIDIQTDYSMPLGEATFTIGLTGTQILKLEDSAVTLDGFQIAAGENRRGELNFLGAALASPEWRVNGFASYRRDRHTLRLQANYNSAVWDERTGIQYGENGEDPVTFDITYLFDITDTFRVSATVVNLTDRDPPKHQIETGYDARLGSPLGRTFEIGLKKTF